MPQICRTCFQEIADKNYIELEDDHQSLDIKTKIEFCIPEIDLTLTAKPVVCILCLNLLNSAFTFKKQCLDTEHSIKKFLFGLEGYKGSVELKDVYVHIAQPTAYTKLEDNTVVDDLNNLLDDALNVQTTPLDDSIDIVEHAVVKVEIDDDDDDVIFLEEEVAVPKSTTEVAACGATTKTTECKPTIDVTTVASELKSGVVKKRSKKHSKRCKLNISGTLSIPLSDDSATPFKCLYCNFSSVIIDILLKHVNCHKDKLKTEKKPYFCPLCEFRTKWKQVIISHMRTHDVYVTTRPKRGLKRKSSVF